MNSATRFMILISAGLAAGASLGAGPAQAAGQTPTAPPAVQVGQPPWNDDDDVIGYFDTRRECEWVGRRGEWRGRWNDYDCEFVRWGWHRGDWRLEVERGGWGGHDDDDDDDDHGPGRPH